MYKIKNYIGLVYSLLLSISTSILPDSLLSPNVVFAHGTGAAGLGQAADYVGATRVHADSRFFADPQTALFRKNAQKYRHEILLPGDQITGPLFPDAGSSTVAGDKSKSRWGQTPDGQDVADHITEDTHILMGVSRGGSAALRGLAIAKGLAVTQEKEKAKAKNLKIVCLESSYADVAACLNHFLAARSKRAGLEAYGYAALSCLPEYLQLAIFQFFPAGKNFSIKDQWDNGRPKGYIATIPYGISTLIVATDHGLDKVVPTKSTIEKYVERRKYDTKNTFLLLLKDAEFGNKIYPNGEQEGSHANIVNTQEGVVFQDVMHALRKKHNLTHDAEFAARGEQLIAGQIHDYHAKDALALHTIQPTVRELMQQGLYIPTYYSRFKRMISWPK